MRARGRALRELSIVQAFDAARIAADASNGVARPLQDYLDELLSDDERLEKSSAMLAAHFDRLIARDEARASGAVNDDDLDDDFNGGEG